MRGLSLHTEREGSSKEQEKGYSIHEEKKAGLSDVPRPRLQARVERTGSKLDPWQSGSWPVYCQHWWSQLIPVSVHCKLSGLRVKYKSRLTIQHV
jgi:hypothetical protein